MEAGHQHIIRLSELQSGIQEVLQEHYAEPFWIIGEISEISENISGHCYLDLVEKDEKADRLVARVRSTIWANTYRMLKPYFETTTGQPLKRGIKILVQASVEYHAVYSLSLNIHDIDPSYTLGDLERKRKEIIARLEQEGVISMNRELPMPPVPQRIAVISSETAAGYGDFTDQLSSNSYGYVFYTRLFPAIMQGDKAVSSIISALDRIFGSGVDFDLVAIIRGGGSKADLDCFDSYDLAYHITQFPLPVITGIGHEQDDTITDLVSHTRLKTPTAVAGFLIEALTAFEVRLETNRRGIVQISEGLLTSNLLKLQLLHQKITSAADRHLGGLNEKLSRHSAEIRHSVMKHLEKQKSLLEKLERIKIYVDPVQVLKLGYSISKYQGRAIRDASLLNKGDLIETTLHKGKLESTVSGITRKDE